jgi:hypothetical protein
MLLQKTDYAYPSTKPHTTHKTTWRYTPTTDWHQNKMNSREALHSLKRTTSLLEKPSISWYEQLEWKPAYQTLVVTHLSLLFQRQTDCSLFSLACILNHVGLQTVYYQFPVSNFTLLTNLLGHTGHRAMKTYPEDKLATEEMEIE